jgi:predicted DNA-binding transcriptional regulator YafY
MSDRLKYERFLWFHGRTKANRFPNARHLAEAFEISARTAQRDIEFIRERLEAPLKYDHNHRGYCYTDDCYELPAVWISESNILALSLAVRLASTIPDQGIKDQLCHLIDRLPMRSGDANIPCLERFNARILVKNIEYSQVDREIFRQVVEALFAGTTLAIIYHLPHTDTTTERNIHPLHLMHYMGSWHLIAWCSKRLELRKFALSRIRKITPIVKILTLPENLPELKYYTRQYFGIMQGGNAT